jgi:hypothetical protein
MNCNIEKIQSDFEQRFVICPMPSHWSEIHKILLKNNKQNIEIQNPLILGGWGASDKEKFERFIYHLSIAQDLGILSKILNYLESLSYDSFLYSLELKSGRPLDKKGYWVLLSEDLDKIKQVTYPALDILEEMKRIHKEITDEDVLYDMFIKNGFNQYNEPKVKRGKSLFIDLLVDLGDIFDRQKCLNEGSEDLEDFCFNIFCLKKN